MKTFGSLNKIIVIPNYKKLVRPVPVELNFLPNLHIKVNFLSFIGPYQYSNKFQFAYHSGLHLHSLNYIRTKQQKLSKS